MSCTALPRVNRILSALQISRPSAAASPRLLFLYPRSTRTLSTTASIVDNTTSSSSSGAFLNTPIARPSAASHQPSPQKPLELTPNLRTHLPLLAAQPPHYITVHIYGKPYLVTVGDTIRLPFLMHGIQPGDTLRLNRASTLGSRDFTLRGGQKVSPLLASTPRGGSAASIAQQSLSGTQANIEAALAASGGGEDASAVGREDVVRAMRIANMAKGPQYLDDRLYICRATVVAVESEPLRVKIKTKPRQRHVRRIKSKMRYTVLRISELTVRDVGELESGAE